MPCQKVVEIVERDLERLTCIDELKSWRNLIDSTLYSNEKYPYPFRVHRLARECVSHLSEHLEDAHDAAWCTLDTVLRTTFSVPCGEENSVHYFHVLRDIFGNPFRPVTFNAAWRTSTVTNLAQAIYDDRLLPSGLFDNQRLGVLADALEEAGCDNADILGHLRGGGEHVRGCHVIDLILGKE